MIDKTETTDRIHRNTHQEHVIAKTKDLALMVTKEITAQEKEPFIVNGLTYLIYPPATLEKSPLAHLPRGL